MVGAEAKNIFGSTYGSFWIGISNDGKFSYQSSGETAVWEMPYYDDIQKTNNIGTEFCLKFSLYSSKWFTNADCTGDTKNIFTVCEIDK